MKVLEGVKTTMYTVRHPAHRSYVWYALVLLVLGLAIGAFFVVHTLLQPQTVLTQSPPVIQHIPATDQPSQHVTKAMLTLDLPAGWIETTPPNVPYTIYSWRGGPGTADVARRLDIYFDAVPSDLAVNRLLPVQADGNHLDVTGVTSDNCVDFTDKTPDSTQTGRAPSKWNGVNFWCDMGNYQRDVVATGSTEGINTITLTGRVAGMRHVLLLYTDNSGSADYSIFVAIVRSLALI